jgi:hypothetical protein
MSCYRSGDRLVDHRYGKTYDYSKKHGIIASAVMLPEGAAERLRDRETLWNAVEAAEKRIDAQLGREYQLALPDTAYDGFEYTDMQALVERYVTAQFTSRGLVADYAIHAPSGRGDDRAYHAHILVTTRGIDRATGEFAATKDRSLNQVKTLHEQRHGWEKVLNTALGEHGRPPVSCESLRIQRDRAINRGDMDTAQSLDRKPKRRTLARVQVDRKLEGGRLVREVREHEEAIPELRTTLHTARDEFLKLVAEERKQEEIAVRQKHEADIKLVTEAYELVERAAKDRELAADALRFATRIRDKWTVEYTELRQDEAEDTLKAIADDRKAAMKPYLYERAAEFGKKDAEKKCKELRLDIIIGDAEQFQGEYLAQKAEERRIQRIERRLRTGLGDEGPDAGLDQSKDLRHKGPSRGGLSL